MDVTKIYETVDAWAKKLADDVENYKRRMLEEVEQLKTEIAAAKRAPEDLLIARDATAMLAGVGQIVVNCYQGEVQPMQVRLQFDHSYDIPLGEVRLPAMKEHARNQRTAGRYRAIVLLFKEGE